MSGPTASRRRRAPTRTSRPTTRVTATFAINTYTLTYTAGANGTITGTSPQTVNHGADGTPVTAVPDAGYRFVGWSDGVTTATRTDTNVTADKSRHGHLRHQLPVNHAPVASSGCDHDEPEHRCSGHICLRPTRMATR